MAAKKGKKKATKKDCAEAGHKLSHSKSARTRRAAAKKLGDDCNPKSYSRTKKGAKKKAKKTAAKKPAQKKTSKRKASRRAGGGGFNQRMTPGPRLPPGMRGMNRSARDAALGKRAKKLAEKALASRKAADAAEAKAAEDARIAYAAQQEAEADRLASERAASRASDEYAGGFE